MLRFGKIKVTKENSCGAQKSMKLWDVDVNNIRISKSIWMRKGFKYLMGYLDGGIRLLVLIMSRMSGCIITFKNNRLMF